MVEGSSPGAMVRARCEKVLAPDGSDSEILVVSMGGETLARLVGLGGEFRVAGVRELVHGQLKKGSSAVQIKLLLGSRVLLDEQTLAELRLPRSAVLQAVVASPGYEHLADLSDPCGAVRSRAAKALEKIGAPAAAYSGELRVLLRDPVTTVRCAAAQAFEKFGRAAADSAQAVEALLSDREPEVRLHAAKAFVRMGEAPLRQAAVLLAHPDAVLRRLGATCSGDHLRGNCGRCAVRWDDPQVAASAELLAALLRDPDREARSCAHLALAQVSPPPVAYAATLLRDGRPGVRAWAVTILFRAAEEAVPFASEVAAVLGDPDADVRLHAARVLGRAGGEGAPHVAALAGLLQDPCDDVRYWSCWAIGKTGNASAAHAAVLGALIGDGRPRARSCRLRCCAARVLAETAQLPGAAPEATAATAAALVAFAREPPAENRRCAAWALGELGPLAAAAAGLQGALGDLLRDADAGVRRCAAEALGKMGPGAAAQRPALVELLEDPSADVRHWAALALGQLG